MTAKASTRTREPDEPQVLRIRAKAKPEAELVALFSIEGDDGQEVTYSIPERVGANIGLKYLRLSASEGEDVAADYLLRTVLGEDAYKALAECDDLTGAELRQVLDKVKDSALADLEVPKGPSGRGRNRSRG